MDNKRCEITVALYGDTSDCFSVPDVVALASPQYYVGAYAMRDANDEESGWYYPVILRFDECDVLIEKDALGVGAKIYPGDACNFVRRAGGNDNMDSGSLYLSRVGITSNCVGERYASLDNFRGPNSCLSLYLEAHLIRIL